MKSTNILKNSNKTKKEDDVCVFCGESTKLHSYKDKKACSECINGLYKVYENRFLNNNEAIIKKLIKELTPILKERNIPLNDEILKWVNGFNNYTKIIKQTDKIIIEDYYGNTNWLNELTIYNDGKTNFSSGMRSF